MRVSPKRTKVRLELFKGIEVVDVLVGAAGVGLAISLMFSNLPGKYIMMVIVLLLTVSMVVPIDDDKGYLFLLYLIRYLGRKREFTKKSVREAEEAQSADQIAKRMAEAAAAGKKYKMPKKKGGFWSKIFPAREFDVEDIMPFTGIDGNFIQYGDAYSAVVMSVPSVEFRFFSEHRQNSVIDRCFAAILRTCAMDEVINLVKVDRPVIYDDYIESEKNKINDLKEAYLNGLLNDDELTTRVGIVYDRIAQLETFDYREKVYQPRHYVMFCYNDRAFLQNQIEDAISTFANSNMECQQLKGKELAVFLKYQFDMTFDEREADNLKPEEYMDWILPDKIKFSLRTVQYDDLVTHNFRLRDYPTMVTNAWGATFFNKIGTRVVMKMTPVDRYKAVKQIDGSIDELREQGGNTGKYSKIMEVSEHIRTLTEVLRLLQGENEILFNVSTYVQANDYELSEHLLDAQSGRAKKNDGKIYGFKKEVRRELAEDG
ncbi:MAG: hypothetical protein IKN07_09100, partial [Lachnospiraceae bacterium]|nr:hypothetical protein [Lachnospiraceae bacterium]